MANESLERRDSQEITPQEQAMLQQMKEDEKHEKYNENIRELADHWGLSGGEIEEIEAQIRDKAAQIMEVSGYNPDEIKKVSTKKAIEILKTEEEKQEKAA